MTNLPSLYARVVAKRPDLAVKWLGRSTNTWADDHPPITVWIYGPSPATSRAMLDDHAAALILARWVEGLPQGYFIAKTCSGFDVAVIDNYACVHWSDRPAFDHPVDALAAFYLGETT